MAGLTRPLIWLFATTIAALLAGCAPAIDASKPLEALGNFQLGHNIVVARNPTVGPLSRKVTEAEWQGAMTTAINDRLGRYEGDKLYHLGISVDGYVLAPPGIPIIASPKSVLIFTVTVWDDAKGGKLNAKPEQLTVLENLSEETLLGSGLTQNAQEQMTNLSFSAANAVLKYLQKHPEWFEDGSTSPVTASKIKPVPAPSTLPATTPADAALPEVN